jgi:hypothetical protein
MIVLCVCDKWQVPDLDRISRCSLARFHFLHPAQASPVLFPAAGLALFRTVSPRDWARGEAWGDAADK